MLPTSNSCLRQCGEEVRRHPLGVLLPILVMAAVLVTWQIAFAQAPTPNPLKPVEVGGNPIFAPVPGVDITKNGAAAAIHGDSHQGQLLFSQNCTTCHGDRGTDGIPNPGSDDGSVPLLNPIDPGFLEGASQSQEAASGFAKEIDLFVQHGSRPSGDDPLYSMIGWGDQKLLTQQQIADIEAYVMQLNGMYWTDRYYPPAEVRMQAISDGKWVTYTINLVNHGGSPLGDITLRDTLPLGLVPVKAGIMGFDQPSDPTDPNDQGNKGQILANHVQFVGTPNVPVGGVLGPFIILARITDPRKPVGPNVAQLLFSFQTFDGNNFMASAVSDPIAPAPPKSGIAAPALPAGGATPTPSAANAPTASSGSVRIVEPNPGALSWGYTPQTITIKAGDKVTWTNTGSLGHSVTADDGSFDSGILNTGDNWGLTFSRAGTYTYHCTPHPWMKATVVVQ